jgi:hypothetical protein
VAATPLQQSKDLIAIPPSCAATQGLAWPRVCGASLILFYPTHG